MGLEALVPIALSLICSLIVAAFSFKMKTEKEAKKELEKEVQKLRTDMTVMQKTAVTEVSLRDYISDRFRESDAASKKEMERLEGKIDGLANMITQIAQHLPKRGED